MNSAQEDEVGTSSVCVKAGGCWPGAPTCTAVPFVLSNCFSVRGLHNFSVITALMEDQTVILYVYVRAFVLTLSHFCNLDVGGPLLAAVIHPGQWTVDSEGMGCPPECPPEPAMWPENLPTLLELPTGSQLPAEDGPGVGSLSVAHTALPTVP